MMNEAAVRAFATGVDVDAEDVVLERHESRMLRIALCLVLESIPPSSDLRWGDDEGRTLSSAATERQTSTPSSLLCLMSSLYPGEIKSGYWLFPCPPTKKRGTVRSKWPPSSFDDELRRLFRSIGHTHASLRRMITAARSCRLTTTPTLEDLADRTRFRIVTTSELLSEGKIDACVAEALRDFTLYEEMRPNAFPFLPIRMVRRGMTNTGDVRVMPWAVYRYAAGLPPYTRIGDAVMLPTVDHIGRDRRDCRRCQLRYCTSRQNAWNRRCNVGSLCSGRVAGPCARVAMELVCTWFSMLDDQAYAAAATEVNTTHHDDDVMMTTDEDAPPHRNVPVAERAFLCRFVVELLDVVHAEMMHQPHADITNTTTLSAICRNRPVSKTSRFTASPERPYLATLAHDVFVIATRGKFARADLLNVSTLARRYLTPTSCQDAGLPDPCVPPLEMLKAFEPYVCTSTVSEMTRRFFSFTDDPEAHDICYDVVDDDEAYEGTTTNKKMLVGFACAKGTVERDRDPRGVFERVDSDAAIDDGVTMVTNPWTIVVSGVAEAEDDDDDEKAEPTTTQLPVALRGPCLLTFRDAVMRTSHDYRAALKRAFDAAFPGVNNDIRRLSDFYELLKTHPSSSWNFIRIACSGSEHKARAAIKRLLEHGDVIEDFGRDFCVETLRELSAAFTSSSSSCVPVPVMTPVVVESEAERHPDIDEEDDVSCTEAPVEASRCAVARCFVDAVLHAMKTSSLAICDAIEHMDRTFPNDKHDDVVYSAVRDQMHSTLNVLWRAAEPWMCVPPHCNNSS